jgi:hypothetical protein
MTADLVLYVQSLEAHLKDAQIRLAAAERVVEAARKMLAYGHDSEAGCKEEANQYGPPECFCGHTDLVVAVAEFDQSQKDGSTA